MSRSPGSPVPLAEAGVVPEEAAGRTPLFLWGTLLDREVLERLLGRRVHGNELEPARLTGFRRVAATGGPYPVLVPDPGARVDGLLLLRPSRRDLRRIAHYEDDYRAALFEVETASGRRLPAWLYLAREDVLRPGDAPWDPALWARRHKAQLLAAIDRWLAELADAEEVAVDPCGGAGRR